MRPAAPVQEAFLPDESNEFSMQFASVMKSSLIQTAKNHWGFHGSWVNGGSMVGKWWVNGEMWPGFLPLQCPESGLVEHAQPEAPICAETFVLSWWAHVESKTTRVMVIMLSFKLFTLLHIFVVQTGVS